MTPDKMHARRNTNPISGYHRSYKAGSKSGNRPQGWWKFWLNRIARRFNKSMENEQ